MTTRRLPIWAQDIPLIDPEVRRLSERAVHQQWAEQLQQQAAERARWAEVLGSRTVRKNDEGKRNG